MSYEATHGPAFNDRLDGERIDTQRDAIRKFMLQQRNWLSLREITNVLGFPEASVSAQLRHLRKPRFGAFDVHKRRRTDGAGTWEYKVYEP